MASPEATVTIRILDLPEVRAALNEATEELRLRTTQLRLYGCHQRHCHPRRDGFCRCGLTEILAKAGEPTA